MEQKPTIVEMMTGAMGKIREMVDVNTVVGEPVSTPDGVTLVPVSRLSFGFGAGGTDWPNQSAPKNAFGGGAGAGVSVTPVCFVVVSQSGVKVLPVNPGDKNTAEKIIDMVPTVIDKVDEMIKKYKK